MKIFPLLVVWQENEGVRKIKGRDILNLAEEYIDFDFEFRYTDGCSKFPNVRTFFRLELCDIGHSDKIVVLTGEEKSEK